MITAIIRGERVTLDWEANWQGASPSLLEKIEAVCAGVDISGADPAPDLTTAEAVCAELGGRIVRCVEEVDDEEADDPNLPPPVYSSGP